jgi:TonB-dependent starch-binding outer membrane protein SusC
MQMLTKLRRITLFLFSLVLSSGILLAQEKTITGKVTAEGEGPIPGVNVTVQGTVVGAMTAVDGSFILKVPGPTSVLVFSSVGYVTQAVTVGTQTVINVTLVSDVKALSEVVVTGYTQQRRRDLTGSIATVEPAKLTAVPVGNVSTQLQGRTAGVDVIGSGVPGETAKVRIRGFSSFENNDPLYIVDGVPTQDISSLNPNDIESLSVLKDAGAASIYGSRASNGVIIVQTKRGSRGTKVTYNMYYGTQLPGSGPTNLLNTQEYADLQWLIYKNDQMQGTRIDPKTGLPIYEVHPFYGDSRNATPTLPTWAANTNWYTAITRNAPIQNHDITLSGGSETAKYFAAVGVFRQDGIVIYTDANKYTGRFNSEFTFLKDRLKVGENITMAYRTGHGASNLNEGSPIQQASYRSQPIIPVIWNSGHFVGLTHTYENGDWGGTGIAARLGQAENEVASLTRGKDNNNWNLHFIGSAYVDVKILQGLHFKSTLGGTMDNGYWQSYSYKTYERSENNATNSFSEGAYYTNDWVWTNQLTFDKTFGQHKILAVAGYEAVKYGIHREVSGNKAGYFSDDVLYRTLDNGANLIAANSSLWTPTTLVSQFGRADYSFMDRYMVSATIRRDGSSRFGPDTRYGVFPSFSVGYRISDEAFFQSLKPVISDLKLRGSYGTMGNQLAVSALNQFYSYGGYPAYSFYDINGTFTSSVQGFAADRIGNPNAKWETNITTDIGFEAGLFNNKVGIKLDWYKKKTKDLLFNPELPATAGVASAPYINIAQMTNTGIDGELSYRNTWGDFGFDGSLVLTTYRNNIDKIAPPQTFFDYGGGTTRIGDANRNMVGHPMSSFFGYKVIGLFQSDAEVSEAPVQDGAAPGFFRYQDTNGDNSITPEDRVFIGNPNPKFTYGINLGFTYKHFDLTAFLYGSYGNDINNWNAWWIDFWPSFQGQKSKKLLYDSWTPERTNTDVPKATNTSNFSTNTQVVSYYIEKGSYLRMKNLQLGYTIPESILNKVNISSLRVYVQAVNLFTITKYSGLDPELGGDDRAFGSDTGNYPLVKQLLVGLNVSF